jgi:hypothetical protein
MINTRTKNCFIKAITNHDANYIKNLYFYRKKEYLLLCSQIEVIHAFDCTQTKSLTVFNDSLLDFWRAVYYINEEVSNVHSTNHTAINLEKLPKYYLEIINQTDSMLYNKLENHTPLWYTKSNLCLLGLTCGCSTVAATSLYKTFVYFEVKDLAQNSCNWIWRKAQDIYSDFGQRAIATHILLSLSCVSLVAIIVQKDSTKEAVTNFLDWSQYKYRGLFPQTEIESHLS